MNIAIIGMSGYLPKGKSLHQIHENLLNKVDCIGNVPTARRELLGLKEGIHYQELGYLDDIEFFDHTFFNISSKEADNMSPEQRLSLELSASAILDAGYSLSDFQGKQCGVFAASQDNEYYSLIREKTGLAWIGSMKSMLSGKLNYHFNLQGPNMIIDTGCSSALICIEEACKRLASGEIEYALTGGITIYLRFGEKNTDGDLLGIEAKDGRCKPFDEKADGIGMGEGGGFFLLKRLEDARHDKDHIYAIIKAAAVSGDGNRCSSITTPSVEGQKEAILSAWKMGNINPDDITEIEAHGTGTKLGDPIEIESLTECFQQVNSQQKKPVYIGSVKSNIGHLNALAGFSSVLKILLEFKHNVIYPLANYQSPNPFINFKETPLMPAAELIRVDKQEKRLAGINSFGLSGTNVHLVLQNHPDEAAEKNTVYPYSLLKISASNKASFHAMVSEISTYICNEESGLNNFFYTMNTGRDDYQYRKIIFIDEKNKMVSQLKKLEPSTGNTNKKIVLITGDLEIDLDKIEERFKRLCFKTSEKKHLRLICFVEIIKYLKGMKIQFDYILADAIGNGILKYLNKEIEWSVLCEIFDSSQSHTVSDGNIFLEKIKEIQRKEENITVIGIGTIQKLGQLTNAAFFSVIDEIVIDQLIAHLYESGYKINWNGYYKETFNKVSAPTYIFQGVRHWKQMDPSHEENQSIQEEEKLNKKGYSSIHPAILLRNIWIDVLECEEAEVIGDDTDFFELGGNSLLITLLIEEIAEKFGAVVLVAEIYEYTTLKKQLALISMRLSEGISRSEENFDTEIRQRVSNDFQKDETEFRLTSMQKTIVKSYEKYPYKSNWNLSVPLRIEGKIDLERMEGAINKVFYLHDILHAKLVIADGRYRFEELQELKSVLEIIEINKEENTEECEAKARKLLEKESIKPIAIKDESFMQVKLYKVNQDISYLLLKISHLVADGWTLNIIFNEICNFYQDPLYIPLNTSKSFQAFSLYERNFLNSDEGRKQLINMKKEIDGFHHRLVRKVQIVEGSIITVQHLFLNAMMIKQMRKFSRMQRVSLFQILLTVYHLSIQEYLGVKDSCVGVMVGNRSNKEFTNTVGLLASTLLTRFQSHKNIRFVEAVNTIKDKTVKILENQMCSIAEISDETETKSFDEYIDFLMTYQNFRNDDLQADGLKFTSCIIHKREAICPMAIVFFESSEVVVASIEYSPDYFSTGEMNQFKAIFMNILENLQKDWDIEVKEQ